MEIPVADERVLLIKEKLSMDQAEGRAWSRKTDAFGAVAMMTSLLYRSKEDDFELVYKEHRYQPFWHVVCSARYVYERNRQYKLALSGPEVESITLEGANYKAKNNIITLSALEHCREEPRQEIFIDGITGVKNPSKANYLKFPAKEISVRGINNYLPEGVIIVPPKGQSSAIVNKALTGVIKSIQADHILEQKVEVERVDFYYRPVYAFQYRWLSKEKEATMEYDALTGKLLSNGNTFKQYMDKILEPEFLFDIGSEMADLILPGGEIAAKLVKRGIDVAKSKGKKQD